jgi:hypothetical protein
MLRSPLGNASHGEMAVGHLQSFAVDRLQVAHRADLMASLTF